MPAPGTAIARIPWHRRIEAVVIVGSSLLVAVSIGAVLILTTRLITTSSLERASADLDVARAAFYHLIDSQTASASGQARLVTALPVFRAHMNDPQLAADPATIQALADEYRGQLNAVFCVVTNRSGVWIDTERRSSAETPAGVRALIASAAEGESRHDLTSIDGRLYLVISEPARFAEETLGTFTVGYALDDTFAAELAAATHSEVTFVAGRRISGTSARPTVRAALDETLRSGQSLVNAPGKPVTIRTLGDGTYVAGASSLFRDRPSADLGALVLLQDWAPTQRFLDELQGSLVVVGLAIFGLALGGGVVFSRRLSGPLKDIADAARDIASGNWHRRAPLRGTAEAVTMAGAFNEMTATVQHWFEEAKDRSERLQASYERFRTVTESARDGIVSIDGTGAIAFWNRSAAIIFECDEQTAMGTPFVGFIDPADQPKYLHAVAFDSPDAVSPTIQLTGVRRNGSRVPLELLLSLSGSGGSSVTALVRDITDRRNAEEVLRQREEELRQAQKMEAIGRLAGGVAHDFNNLLTAIHGFAELLVETKPDAVEHRDYVDEILKAAQRAAQLTGQLLAFSRRQVLAPQVIALDRVLEDTEKMLRRLIGEDVILTCETESTLGMVKADPGQIEQAIVNLAVNARDAMPNGGRLSITLANIELDSQVASRIEGLSAGRYVRMDVVDNGIGMNEETMSKIFEPFFTTKEAGKGTGLGLAMVYGLVRQSGGSIEVESRLGAGTRFRIYLPQCEEAAIGISPLRQESPQGSETLLLVEDDAVVRELLGTTLRKYGYTVLEAPGAHAALEVSRSTHGPIHLLLTDVVMPQMNGRRLAEILRLERAATRVLFMSGYSDDAVLRAGVQAYDTPFIQKPFSAEALAMKVREALE
jgi:PAS domain S-box-containing protein